MNMLVLLKMNDGLNTIMHHIYYNKLIISEWHPFNVWSTSNSYHYLYDELGYWRKDKVISLVSCIVMMIEDCFVESLLEFDWWLRWWWQWLLMKCQCKHDSQCAIFWIQMKCLVLWMLTNFVLRELIKERK